MKPNFEKLAEKAKAARVPNEWFHVPAQEITIGMDDPEDATESSRPLGWDNEKPSRNVQVHAFEAQGSPITNEEYVQYLQAVKGTRIPASWAQVSSAIATNGQANGVAKTNGVSLNGHSYTNGHSVDPNSLSHAFLKDKAVRTVYDMVLLKYALDWPVFASYSL